MLQKNIEIMIFLLKDLMIRKKIVVRNKNEVSFDAYRLW